MPARATRLRRVAKLSLTVTLTLAGVIVSLLVLARSLGPVQSASERSPLAPCREGGRVADGAGAATGDGVVLEALSAASEAFVVCPLGEPIEARRWPILTLRIEDFPPNHMLLLGWRRPHDTEAAFTRLQAPGFRRHSYYLPTHPAWRGRIEELALYIAPQAPAGAPVELDRPLTIHRFALHPDGLVARIRAFGTSWFSPDPWTHRSLHTLGKHPDVLELPRRTPFLLLAWAIGLVAAVIVFRVRDRLALLRVAALAALPWACVAHGHWLASFAWQRSATHALFGGLTPLERRYRQYDGELAALADRLKALIRPEDRLFLDVGDELTRYRLAWFLRPRNLYERLPGLAALRPGDLILRYEDPVARRPPGQERAPLAAPTRPLTVLWQEDGSALLRVER